MSSTECLLSKFKLEFESPMSADQLIAEAIARNWARSFRKAVLFINKAGLLPIMKFGKRSR
ncbi:hypothetical protein [Mycolicibacterium sp. J2]|uniref:hypothetical protein n=1 Tax=Mycolicibacterium sp. J2 TaxID=2993511 RepID=UPI00224AC8E9|nr:hypothetical protein [Mycolicibacterium sp. J2]MCX2716088.1 hypothetical protein [Mycolicibacterium sp. J2]